MGVRFRKSIKLGGGVRVNLSKKGVGVSVGTKGFRVGVGPRGVRTTASIPGTGLSYSTERKIGGRTNTNHTTSTIYRPSSSPGHGNTPAYLSYRQLAIGPLPIYGIMICAVLALFTKGITLILIPFFIYIYIKNGKSPYNKYATFYNNAINAYHAHNDSEAINSLHMAMEHAPEDDDAMVFLLTLYHDRIKDYKHAIECVEKLLGKPRSETYKATLYAIRGSCYYELKQYNSALADLRRTDTIPGHEGEREIILADCYIRTDQPDQAIELLKNGPARKRNATPEMLKAKYLLGKAYLLTGDAKKAKVQLTTVCTHDNQYEDVIALLAELGVCADK